MYGKNNFLGSMTSYIQPNKAQISTVFNCVENYEVLFKVYNKSGNYINTQDYKISFKQINKINYINSKISKIRVHNY